MTDEEVPAVATADSPHATLLVDGRNGFNELGRKTMLWTVRHTWAAGARFAFNCYRHAVQHFPEPAKSILICPPADMAAAKAALSRFDFRYQDGARYVGGFIGTEEAKEAWPALQIATWVEGIHALARISNHYPQTAYAGLSKSLQAEWQYMHRVVENAGDHFGPIEEALANVFIPALLGGKEGGQLRELFTLPVRQAGLNLPNPRREPWTVTGPPWNAPRL
jgi:hypothetical protein